MAKDDLIVARMMAMSITCGAARRLFPGVSRSALYLASPHDGHGRRLSLGRAFEIARAQFEAQAGQARAARAAEARTDALAARQVAAALPALDHLAGAVDAQNQGLLYSLRLRGASERAVKTMAKVVEVNARHCGRARAHLQRVLYKAGPHVPTP